MDVQLYKTIENEIKETIRSGKLRPGDKLPSEAELMEQYGASKMTVRKSISDLEQEGLVYSIQRVGNYVATPATDKYIVLFDELKKIKGIDRIDMISTHFTTKGPNTAAFGILSQKARILSIERLFKSEERVIAYDRKMLLYHKDIDISEYEMTHYSFATLMTQKLEQFAARHELVFEAIGCTQQIGTLLNIREGSAIASVTQNYFDASGRLSGLSNTYCLPEYIEMHAESV
ncbi:MAG: GntR family transcriptional regulator [Anaerofustis sp.]